MSKIKRMIVLAALVFSPTLFAHGMSESSDCRAVAEACVKGGYAKAPQSDTSNFWHDCMKPVLLGKSVKGITVPSSTVASCRAHKITKMQEELKELQNVH